MSAFSQSFASFCIPSDCCLPVNVNLTHQDSISSTCPLRAALKGLDRKARKCGIVMHCCVFQRCLDSFCKNNKFVSWSDSSLMRISDQEKHDLPHILKWLHLTALVILCHSQLSIKLRLSGKFKALLIFKVYNSKSIRLAGSAKLSLAQTLSCCHGPRPPYMLPCRRLAAFLVAWQWDFL